LLNHLAANIDQAAILHTGGTGGFAITTAQAAIKMLLGNRRDGLSFQHLFHQIDATARAIQLVAQQLIGWAGRVAKSAMHTTPQNGFGFLTLRGMANEFSELSLHSDFLSKP
jgi:hypothetical protein